jgi:N-acetylglucosaminyldiphosphoundecaprenol N-acetyl-beta-D-mannosaminyltransferase
MDALTRSDFRASSIPKLNVLGVGVDAVDLAAAVGQIVEWVRTGRRTYVCVTGVHGIMESVRNETVRYSHNGAGLVVPDGMPLVWLLKGAGYANSGHVRGADLMLAVFDAQKEMPARHYLYGATRETLVRLRANLLRKYPHAQVVGSYSPPFRAAGLVEEDDVVAMINESEADILWIGLSTPKQELWMANHRPRLTASVLIGTGAAFDFNSGQVRQAPRFLQECGLEWSYRLAREPGRLAGRYLHNNPLFVLLLIAQMLGLKQFPLDREAAASGRSNQGASS